MPVTKNIIIKINEQVCDLPSLENLNLNISYELEDPENFQSKGGSYSLGLTLPATQTNDKIFNTYYNPLVKDMTGIDAFTDWMPCSIRVEGIELFRGVAMLKNASHTRIPEDYSIELYSQNVDWLVLMKDLTVWDCLNPNSHTFDVATIEASWANYDSDENHDYCYFPVRYRQPFDGSMLVDGVGNSLGLGTDDTLNIYHLRPSISLYWLLIRGFRQFGYSIDSQFLNTSNYFRRMTMAWTHGDFLDIDSQLVQGICFKVGGRLPTDARPAGIGGPSIWFGTPGADIGPGASEWQFQNLSAGGWDPTGYHPLVNPQGDLGNGVLPTGGIFVFKNSGTFHMSGGWDSWQMDQNFPPEGFDTFLLYSFDDATGIMQYNFNPPAELAGMMTNVSITFEFSLYLQIVVASGGSPESTVALDCRHNGTLVHSYSMLGGSFVGTGIYPNVGATFQPTVLDFTLDNINPGDVLQFRLRCIQSGGGTNINVNIFQAMYLNNDPAISDVPIYQYNPETQEYSHIPYVPSSWSPLYSTFTMKGFLLQIGNNVNLKNYDKFRSYKFLDLLAGLVDTFNLSIQTDPISRTVTIEPTHGYVLPDGTRMRGYFTDRMLDWSTKRDMNKKNTNFNYNDPSRQFDFQLQLDGNDGAQNIFAARYKAIYLNNLKATMFNNVNSSNNENGLIAAIPGVGRYLFPERFPRGSTQHGNRFFGATMHYKHTPWANIPVILSGGSDPALAPQLICIFPENTSGSSAGAITATFTPKIVFYSGQQNVNATGTMRWVGDPNAGGNNQPSYNDAGTGAVGGISAIGFQLPYAYAVDYTGRAPAPGEQIPVLSYGDQNIGGTVTAGLMKIYFLKRLAIMRAGRICKMWMRLKLSDITDWEHRYTIIIDGATYYLVGIDNYNPLSDESSLCTFWKQDFPNASDLANMFPSSSSILTNPLSLPQYDLKYAPLLLFYSDIPNI